MENSTAIPFNEEVKIIFDMFIEIDFTPFDSETFTTELTMETSMSAQGTELGGHESTMTLRRYGVNKYEIEWDIPTLETTEYIIFTCTDNTRFVEDYEGIMTVPKQALELLQRNGFDTTEIE